MRQKTLVYANTIDWDFKGLTQRPHHLMRLLAERNWKVYYVNQTQRADRVRERICENLEVYHNWNVFLKRVPECDVYFSSWANRYVDLDKIKAKVVVYDSLDAFPDHEPNELKMINRADIVLAASQPLYDLRSQQHKNVHLCKNACFEEHGSMEYEVPHDLVNFKKTGKPIILFSGALSSTWCDLELVEKIAKRFTLVVVGRGWAISQMPNGVHYLGQKTHDELQAYYRHCDVNILPFQKNQIGVYSSPIKKFEAMIHGTPTVATDIPEALAYEGVVLTSTSHEEFINNIKKAIQLKKCDEYKNKAINTGKENTWKSRVDVIDSAIQKFCLGKGIVL